MKTIIIEDEPLVAKDLQKVLAQIDPSIEIVATLESLEACVEYFRSNDEPDLLFMDVQLSDGVSFDLFKKVDIRCPIIFTTAYNEYALRAFKVNSVDYLLKPIDRTELKSAIDKFKAMTPVQAMGIQEQLKQVMEQMAKPASTPLYKERFMAHSGKSFIVVNEANIAYFLKDTLIYIVTNDKQQFVTDFESMEEVEELLNPKLFYRANRQYIVHVNAIESFKTDVYSKLIVKLKSPLNNTIDISREKAQTFRKWIG